MSGAGPGGPGSTEEDGAPRESGLREAGPRPRPWWQISSQAGEDLRLFRVRVDTLENPRNARILDRLVLETPDWVNVIALTDAQEVVLVRQFRFGTGTVTLEIPGGVVSPGEASEAAAGRELREETGYTANRWTYLGAVEANPAVNTNLCHHWLAEGARLTDPTEFDEGEDIQVVVAPLATCGELVRAGEIRHALVVSAFAHVLDLRTEPRPLQ